MKAPAPAMDRERAAEVSKQHNENNAAALECEARPLFVLKLAPLPGFDGHRAMRELLKRARRTKAAMSQLTQQLIDVLSDHPLKEAEASERGLLMTMAASLEAQS